ARGCSPQPHAIPSRVPAPSHPEGRCTLCSTKAHRAHRTGKPEKGGQTGLHAPFPGFVLGSLGTVVYLQQVALPTSRRGSASGEGCVADSRGVPMSIRATRHGDNARRQVSTPSL